MKEWLTPSSWLSSWNRSSNDATGPSQLKLQERRLAGPPQSGDMPTSSHSTSPLFVPRPGALINPFLSNPMALLGVPGSQPGPSEANAEQGEAPPTSVDVVGSRNRSLHSESKNADTGMESRLRSLVSMPISLRSSGVPSGPTSMANATRAREDMKMTTDASSSKDSEGSWVAEDDGSMEQEVEEEGESVTSDGRGQSSEQIRTKSLPTSLNLSSCASEIETSEVYTYELGKGSAGVVEPAAICVTPVVVNEAEQVIQQVENPAAESPPPPSTCPSSSYTTPVTATSTVATSTNGRRTMLSSSLLNRLYTTNPFAMSTPQLSPVHESREDDVSIHLSLSLSLSLSQHDHIFYSTTGSSRIWSCSEVACVPFWF